MAQRTVIIGGGVVGAMCAYFLSADGHDVTVVDRGRFGAACSHGNCGYVCPSHVLPLTVPGVIRSMGLRAFSKNSPLYIKPRLSPALWSWMLRFARNCTPRQMMAGARGLAPMLDASRTLYAEIIERESLACEWQTDGMVFVYQTKSHLDEYESTASMIEREFGKRYEKWDEATLLAAEPALKPGRAAGAWFFAGDAQLRPDRLMSELRRVLEARGVTIIEDAGVTRVARDGGTARAVVTSEGDVDGDHFVFATGAYTPQLAKAIGATLPIQPGKGYSITMPRPSICPKRPLIFEEHRVAITPMQSGYRIGSTMEFSGYDESLDPARLDALVAGASHYLREPTADPVVERWAGFRPMTPDSLPVIDHAPIADNVWIAAGHNMLGLSMAPATGQLIAEMIGRREPTIDPRPYTLARF